MLDLFAETYTWGWYLPWTCDACPRDSGASALHEASKDGQAGVVSLLLERGADPHVVGTGGFFEDKSPLQVSRGPRRKCFREDGISHGDVSGHCLKRTGVPRRQIRKEAPV